MGSNEGPGVGDMWMSMEIRLSHLMMKTRIALKMARYWWKKMERDFILTRVESESVRSELMKFIEC